jgi:uncharacterized repeat protein (TIGR01451 family)
MKEPDFELSADMRLLELQRGALGLPVRERTGWESSASNGAGLPLSNDAANEPVAQGALLTVDAIAFPSNGVIPGAVVTLTLTISNEGTVPAGSVVAGVPLPGGAAYRPGSFVWNGRSSFDDVAESFLGAGLQIGAIGPSERATFEWKIGVKLGIKPLHLAPSVRAAGAAVLGARPISIGRKASSGGPFAGELERVDAAFHAKPLIPVDIPVTDLPIYELDDEEIIIAEAAQTALSEEAPQFPLQVSDYEFEPKLQLEAQAAPELEIEAAPELDTEAEPEAGLEAEETPTEPELHAEPELEIEPETQTVREAIVLSGRFDRATIAFFERVFLGTKAPTILQHCIFGGALACSSAPEGDGAGLKAHLDAQAQMLHRVALHEKLGKKEPLTEYAGDLLAHLDRLRKAPVESLPLTDDSLVLRTELSEPTVVVLRRIGEDPSRWDFVRARQLTLALQAETVARAGLDEGLQDEITLALRGYAQASVTVLQKLFVRMRIDRTTAILLQTDHALDFAARALIGVLKRALP